LAKTNVKAPSTLGFGLLSEAGSAKSAVYTGFRASQRGRISKKCRFLAVSVPKPRNSSKPLSWLGLRCAIIASAAKGAAARPTDTRCPALLIWRGSGAVAARRRGARTYNRRVRAVRVNL